MKIVIPGGSGQIGTMLTRAFANDGDEAVVLSRTPAVRSPWRVREWNARSAEDWASEFEGADAVINLAGRSVGCRYTQENRRLVTRSDPRGPVPCRQWRELRE